MMNFLPSKRSLRSVFSFVFLGLLSILSGSAFAATKTATTNGTWATTTWSPSAPVAGDDIVIAADVSTGPGSALSFASLTVNSGFTFTHTAFAITLTGNLTVAGTYQLTNVGLTVNGTTSVTGTLDDNNATATNRFDGLVTVSGTGAFTTSVGIYEFRGGLTNNGTCSLTGTGAKTFGTNSQALAGSAAITLGSVTINSGITLTNNNTGTVSVGALTLNGTFTDGSNSGSNVFTGLVSPSSTGTLSGATSSPYDFQAGITTVAGGSVSLTGSGTITFSATQNLSHLGPITIPNMTVSSGATVTLSNTSTFTNTGTSTIDGSVVIASSGSGLKLFTGLITVSATGSVTNSNVAPLEFRGGITNNGTFTLVNTGTKTFSTNNQAIGGTGTTSIANVTVSNITLTNNGTFTVSTSIDGPGSPSSLVQGVNSTFNFGAAAPASIMGTSGCTFNPAASGNTVNFTSASSQNVRSPVAGYYNLTTSGGGTKTIYSNPNVANDLTIGAGTTFSMNNVSTTVNNLIINGNLSNNVSPAACNLTVTGATTLSGSGRFINFNGPVAVEFQGGIINNSTLASNLGSGQIYFTTNNQSITGSPSAGITIGGNVQIASGVEVTNTMTATIAISTGTLDGDAASSKWINGSGATLTYGGTAQPFATFGTLDASAAGNTIGYNRGGAQTIRNTTYDNLTLAGSGTKSATDFIVNNTFAESGSPTLSASGTATFATSAAGSIILSGSFSFNDIIINKTGSSLTVSGATGSLSFNNVNVAAGTFDAGTTARTIIVNGDLSGPGTVSTAGVAGNILELRGANNTIGAYTSAAGNTVSYTGSSQNVFSTTNYRRLNLAGSGTKSLSGNATVSDTLYFATSTLFSLGTSNLTMSQGTRIKAGTPTTNAAFGVTRMIVTDGTGVVIKQGTSAADFTSFSWSTSLKNGGQFPVGTTGFFSPYEITGLTATVAGTGSISVRAVPTKQPNVPYYNNAAIKYWELASTNLTAISANMSFTYNNPGEVVGSQLLYEGRVWDGASLLTPATPSAPGSNPFTTTGSTFITGSWTAIDPTNRNVYYTYVSGDYGTAGTWTTDPSGSTLINAAVPGSGDQIVILNGRTVTTTVSRTCASLTINSGAVFDATNTTSNNFGPVSGTGLYRQSSITLPTATFTAFSSTSGGTFEYYDLPAGTNVLGSGLTAYNNLLITNSTGTNYTIAQDHNVTVNGNLTLSRSGAGTATFTVGNSATGRTLSVGGNATVGAGCTWNIGSFNVTHTISIYGNLSNSGTIVFNNTAAAYTASTTGQAALTFYGATSNTTFTNNSGAAARFYNFRVDKTVGYELYVSAAAGFSPEFWSNNTTVLPVNGTLRLGTNVTLSLPDYTGGNYDIGTSSTIPTFWVDGASVSFIGGNSIVVYGTLRVSSGTLTVAQGAASIVLRETGFFLIEGGTVTAEMFRTSNTATTHRGAFQQTGGTFNLIGTSGGPQAGYSIFTLPYPDNVFKMSGGTINITRSTTGPVAGIQIASTIGNYEVTAGTININLTAGVNFDIAAAAPLYHVNIAKASGAAASVRLNSITGSGGNENLAAQPLTILGNLYIDGTNSPIFNPQNFDVTVKGNFEVASGGTYQTGTQTTMFNGGSAQTFTVNGSLSSGLSSVAITKSTSTLTLAGSVTPITLRGGLSINSGTLADAGKTINVAGNIVNNGTHSGAGKIVLNSSTASQTISGTATSYFGNLDFSNTNGATGSTQITVSSHLQLAGSLGLTQDRVANIGSKQIILGSSGAITGSFSANRYIRTNGLLSDGGIKKTFSNTSAFVFPFGAGSNYTPATIQFSSAPSTYGTLDVRPVGTKQLYVTDPNCFDLYWKVKTSGFTGIPAGSVNYTFNYGSLTDNATYIPAFYDYAAIAYTVINDVTQVNETTNNIHFTGVSHTDGDYTAGNPAAFGIVTPFYSRTSGNWNTPSTWSNTSHAGAAAVSIPASNSPVMIGDGATYNHVVDVTTNSTISGSLIVDAGSTLDCQVTTGNNFGAIPYATAGGAGKIRISSATSTAEFPAGDFGLFFQPDGGTAEYYTTGAQDFTIPSATASPNVISIDSYKWLNINPGSGRTITLPDKNLTIYEDLTVNGNATGVAAQTPTAARAITVNDDLFITSGILELGSSNAQSLTIQGDATVSNGGTLRTQNSGSATHNIYLEGNLSNEGNISLNNATTGVLTFQGAGSKVWNGSNGSASVSLSSLVVNKGTSVATELEVSSLGSFTAPTNGWLTISNGMLKWSKGNTMTLTDQVGDYTIPSTAGLTINHASTVINVGMANSADADLVLDGKLSVQAGTLNIGDNANNHNNDLEYASGGTPEFEVTGNGAVNVNGQIRRSTVVQSGSLKYTQSGNSQVLVRGKNADPGTSLTYDRGKFEILNTNSEFNMSGNSVLTISRSGLPNGVYYDIYLAPATANITGGEIRIGNTVTPASQTFFMSATSQFWNLSVDGTTNAKTLRLVGNPITVQKDLAIESNSIFNANGLNVTVAGNFTNQNTNSSTGVTVGGYQPGTTTQITTFNGTTASQTITGVSGNLTNFANLVVNNTFTGGSVSLATNTNVRTAGYLTLTAGTFATAGNTATVLGNVANNGGHTSTGSGYLVMAGTSGQTISSSTTSSFGSLRINNSAGVELTAPASIAGDLNLQTGIFYINNYLLSLGVSATVSGTFTSSVMIRTNGVTSDAGVTKSYPASAHDFTFPVGTTLRYTPARFNVTSNTVAGTINLKPVAVKHPATTDAAAKELTYYWRTTATGFNGSTAVSPTYNYISSDVNGTEASYVTGRFFSNAWTPIGGIASTVNAGLHRFTLTGVNYFNGDYTAGEPSEFQVLPTYYSRNATNGGPWNDPNSWSNDPILQHTGAPDGTTPNYNPVDIAAGHTITVPSGGYNAVSSVVNGSLSIGNTIGHNFGNVSGTGRVVQTPTVSNAYVFPGGDYSVFTSATGGTFEFGGTIPGTLSTQATYHSLEFSGSATKTLSSSNLAVSGNVTITAGVVNNASNANISLVGNWTNSVGIGGFVPGTGEVNLSGATQTLTGATAFYKLTTSGAGNKNLTSSISVTNTLTLTSGIFVTGANTLNVAAGATTAGGSATSHVNGNLGRGIAASATTTTFRIGDGTNYTPVTITYTGTTAAGGFITGSTTVGDHPNIYTSGLDQTKSANRYWTLTNSGVTGFTGYSVVFNFVTGDLDVGANTASFAVGRYSSGTWTLPTVGTLTGTSSQATGISGTVFGDFQLGNPVDGNIWTGATNKNWNLASNWIPNVVPTSTVNAIIGNVVNQPDFLSGSNGQCKKLVLYAGANPTIPSGYTLTVNDNIEATTNTIDGTGTLSINGAPTTLTGALTVNCNLSIAATRTLALGVGSTLNVGHDLAVSGTLTHNNLPVNFTGSGNSVISGTLNFYDLVVNKSSSGLYVQLGNNANVSHHLDMQSGDVELNTHTLDLGTTGTLENETSANRVSGTTGGFIQATRTLNAPSAVNVGNLGAIITSGANLGSTLITRRHNQVIFGLGFGINRVYGIHPTTNTALNATLVFNYFDDELNTVNGNIMESEIDLWRYNGMTYDRQYATLNMGANTLTKTAIPQFSNWTAASHVNNPLAIELAYFEMSCKDNKPVATWRTLKEADSKWFVLEGRGNGSDWEEVGRTKAAGNSAVEINYSLALSKMPGYIKQVRLTMIDDFGATTLYNTRSVNCDNEIAGFQPGIYPNPNDGQFTLDFGMVNTDRFQITVVNVLGQVLATQEADISRLSFVKMDLRGLSPGVYRIQVTNKENPGDVKILPAIIR